MKEQSKMPALRKPKLFAICSQAFIDTFKEAEIEDLISSSLNNCCELVFWRKNVGNHDEVLQALQRQGESFDFALCIFSKDASAQAGPVLPNSNVVFESGLFVGAFGDKERVFILLEDGLTPPSDISGFSNAEFTRDKISFSKCLADIAKKIDSKKCRNPNKSISLPSNCEDLYGLKHALEMSCEYIEKKINVTHDFFSNGALSSSEFLSFYSNEACKEAYVGGLSTVTKRYWTTSRFGSPFWSETNEVRLMAANSEMTERLAGSGDLRRLFLLPCSLDTFRDSIDKDITEFERRSSFDDIDAEKVQAKANELKDRYHSLRETILLQQELGFDIKFAFDKNEKFSKLPKELTPDRKFDPENYELAIFDDSRVDVYKTGRSADIFEMRTFTPMGRTFKNGFLRSCDDYFQLVWDSPDAKDVDYAIEKIFESIEHAERRIDYKKNWLVEYEYLLNTEDKELKEYECARVKELLEKRTFTNYLDVGTCTARYPICLREFMDGHGLILGLDEDEDCIEFSDWKLRREGINSDERTTINLVNADFMDENFPDEIITSTKFDLVTCMLGTISHFGEARRNRSTEEMVSLSIKKLCEVLTDTGVLFISSWSDYAVKNRKLLSIYGTLDKRKLCDRTVSSDKLVDIFKENGLNVVDTGSIKKRLDLYMLSKAI